MKREQKKLLSKENNVKQRSGDEQNVRKFLRYEEK